MEEEFYACLVTVFVDVVDSSSVEGRGTTDNSVNLFRERVGVMFVLIRSMIYYVNKRYMYW